MYSILKVAKKSQNYSAKGCDDMRLIRTITIGIIGLITGLFLGLILFLIIGTPETWQNWQYGTCYAIPFSTFIIGILIGWKKYNDDEVEVLS